MMTEQKGGSKRTRWEEVKPKLPMRKSNTCEPFCSVMWEERRHGLTIILGETRNSFLMSSRWNIFFSCRHASADGENRERREKIGRAGAHTFLHRKLSLMTKRRRVFDLCWRRMEFRLLNERLGWARADSRWWTECEMSNGSRFLVNKWSGGGDTRCGDEVYGDDYLCFL